MSCVVERTAGPSFQTVVIKRHFHCSEVPNRIATYRGGKLRLKDKPIFSCLRSRGSGNERNKERKKERTVVRSIFDERAKLLYSIIFKRRFPVSWRLLFTFLDFTVAFWFISNKITTSGGDRTNPIYIYWEWRARINFNANLTHFLRLYPP